MKNPAISIILPFYNAKATLSRALGSIINQTFPDFECILIDNNSTDGSTEITMEHIKKDSRFKLIQEPRQGVAFAHNAGMKISQASFIARMDADDWMFPDRLEQQIHFLENNTDYGVVSGLAKYIPHSQNTEGFRRYVEWSNSIIDSDDIFLKQFMESPVINPSAMWRREASDKFGSYKHGHFPEDYELWLRWLGRGVKIHKLSIPVIKWYDSAKRLTRTDERYNDQAFFNIKTEYLAKWLAKNNSHHPKVAVWGASKISRNRAAILEENGIQILQYIDITRKRQLDRTVVYYEDIPEPGKLFILVYLKEQTMRLNTVEFLKNRGYEEGVNFLMVS